MKSKLIAAGSAALLSLSLIAGAPVLAQAMLDDAVTAQLVDLGFLPADWVITEAQLIELQNVLSSTESEQLKQDQVKKIMGINSIQR